MKRRRHHQGSEASACVETRIRVQPDERIHERMFPPPPVTELIDQIPHDWLTAFEDFESWDISLSGVRDPKARRCVHRPLFHSSHIEMTWESTEHGKIILTPPQHLKLPDSWDAIDFWIGGHPTDFRNSPWIEVSFRCSTKGGTEQQFEMCESNWLHRRYAVDMFHRLVPSQIRQDLQGGALEAIEIRIPESKGPYPLELYALTFYRYHRPRHYERPTQLSFPVSPDGIVPAPKTAGVTRVEAVADTTVFSFETDSGSGTVYTYSPRTGTLADLTACVDEQAPFHPCLGGGLVFEIGGSRREPPYQPPGARLLSQKLEGGRLTTRWEIGPADERISYSLCLRIVNRSLVIEAQVDGPSGVEFRIGYPDHAGRKRPVEVPMMTWYFTPPGPANDYYRSDVVERKAGLARSPAVLLAGDLFMSAIFDWYASDASFLYPLAEQKSEAAGFDGGAYYVPAMDSDRNPLREKLILTVSKEFQETLPNIPNPPSPFLEEMKDRVYVHGDHTGVQAEVYRNLGISAVATLAQIANRYCDTGACRSSQDMGDVNDWIDRASQLRGGVDRLLRRAEELRAIGWLVGTYVNYALMNPMFRVYAELPSAHDAKGFHRSIWNGSTVPAQGEAIAYARRQVEKMKSAFGFQMLYADQTTAYAAYDFTDYTPGVPGAAKFREAYEQIGQLYLTLKDICRGPVFSEGGIHWTYSGIVDGNLGSTQDFAPWGAPPPADLVDFHLQKINPLSADCCGNSYYDSWAPEARDRFICQTLAYGKIGHWTPYSGAGQETLALSCRSYFTWHLAQKRYRSAGVEQILYHNGRELVDTSTILKEGKEHLGRVYVKYQNGLESWTNLHESESWTIEVDGEQWVLPASGWFQRRREEWGEFQNYSVIQVGEGRRSRVQDRDTTLVAASGRITSFPDVETDGTAIIRRESTHGVRVINLSCSQLRVRVESLGLPVTAESAVVRVFDLEGGTGRNRTVTLADGWIDFAFLAQEQFASSEFPRR